VLDGGEPVGVIGLSNVVRGPMQSAIVSYWMDERHTRRGLASAALGEVVGFAFGELDLHRLEAGTLVANIASQRVLEKNGFRRYGLAQRYLLIGGEWRDHVLFERIAE
jgi:ribosomal-protein-alanine N-acetyltransferase